MIPRRTTWVGNVGMWSCLLPLAASLAGAAAAPMGTAFTYQGQLKDGGIPANGEYDVWFTLYDAASDGAAVSGPLYFDGGGGNGPTVTVTNGLFQVELDFPGAFDGRALWLQIEARRHAAGSYVALLPRQPLTAAPYALYTLGPRPWEINGGDIHTTQSGNVGIGTDAPAAKLHVAGDIRSDGPSGDVSHNPNNPSAVAALGWIDDVARIRIGGDGNGSTGGLDIQKTGDRSLMRIHDSGDVWCRGGIQAVGDIRAEGPAGVIAHNPNDTRAVAMLGWWNDVARIRIGGDGDGASGGLDIQKTGDRSLMRVHNSGDVWVRGAMDLGYRIVRNQELGRASTASCPAGYLAVGGGCDCASGADTVAYRIDQSRPLEDGSGWECSCGSTTSATTTQAICLRVR